MHYIIEIGSSVDTYAKSCASAPVIALLIGNTTPEVPMLKRVNPLMWHLYWAKLAIAFQQADTGVRTISGTL